MVTTSILLDKYSILYMRNPEHGIDTRAARYAVTCRFSLADKIHKIVCDERGLFAALRCAVQYSRVA